MKKVDLLLEKIEILWQKRMKELDTLLIILKKKTNEQ